jgi:hypothetical protein
MFALFDILNTLNIQKWGITQNNLDIMFVASQQLHNLRHCRPVTRVRLGTHQPNLQGMQDLIPDSIFIDAPINNPLYCIVLIVVPYLGYR